MCPICISTVALTVAGATSTGGLTAFVVKKLLPKTVQINPTENRIRRRAFRRQVHRGIAAPAAGLAYEK
jgi:hypothetical protein